MIISTKGRYGLRVMLDIAQNQQDGYVSLKTVSCRQAISFKYLELVTSKLVKADLLTSMRGKIGGYRLSREPKDYTVKEILDALEIITIPVSCMKKGAKCDQEAECLTLPLYQEINHMLEEYLKSVTLADLLEGKLKKID